MGIPITALRAMLSERLGGELPGAAAQKLLAPVPRPGWQPDHVPEEAMHAAVLALILPVEGRPGLLLTERTESLEAHRGQVSFPGGRTEAGETLEATALRETCEETGIPTAAPMVLGRLSELWIPATGYVVTPIVATLEISPALRPSPDEVQRIITVPFADLMAPGAVHHERRSEDGIWTDVRYFDVSGTKLWGATAMMVAELLVVLGWAGPEAFQEE